MVEQVIKQLVIGLIVTLMTVTMNHAGVAGTITHKRFVIHVPMKMKSHHHTHTVYTHIHHGGGKVEYKVLGYTQQHGVDGHVEASEHGVPVHGTGSLVFNHYARNGEDHLQDEYSSDYEDWDS
ncbi:uncharacterized protein LOC129949029 [Eupeodes corollae]|uniref:uncharacterized protein LOC129949029 n=1 Tax=Eupeodes corollae TaxID=290404 RepID=UPI0024900689|nr:uncharacterized protein LOC129949029 [Eupeodes corollae]